jgi:hypothetical protein
MMKADEFLPEPDLLYDWELTFEDNTKWRRSQNVQLSKDDPAHIDPQNPPRQVMHVRWIPIDPQCIELNVVLPSEAQPICYWTPRRRVDNMKLAELIIYIGYKYKRIIIKQSYQVAARKLTMELDNAAS